MSALFPVATMKDLELVFVERILELDGSVFDQGRTKGRWKEAKKALVVEGEAHARGHLAFNVFAESGRNTGRARGRGEESVRTIADVVVLFMYHLRPGSQLADAREASLAARDVVATLLRLPETVANVDVVNSWRPSVVAGGEWLLVRIDLTAAFDLSLLPRSSA